MVAITRFVSPLWDLDNFFIFEDFRNTIVAEDWTKTVTDSGTILTGDLVNGQATILPADGATNVDNDESYLASVQENFKYQLEKPFMGKCRLRFTETAAGIYNVGFGFMNAVGADTLIDDGGGPKLSGSTLAIYKTDGSSLWKVASACNGVSTVTTSNKAAVGATWYVLEINCNYKTATEMSVVYQVDGEILKDSNNRPIEHIVPIANATEMQVWVGSKLGAATNNDPTLVDYIYAGMVR